MITSGQLIVCEGPDGVGKSAIAAKLAASLRMSHLPCVSLAFPGNDPNTLGHLIYRIHHSPKDVGVIGIAPGALQILHVAAHADAIESAILPRLAAGESVILDRYWWSTWAYGRVAGVSASVLDAMIDLERQIWGTTRPDFVILIERPRPWRDEESQDKHEALSAEYSQLATEEAKKCRVIRIANDGPIDDVVAELTEQILVSTRCGAHPSTHREREVHAASRGVPPEVTSQLGLALGGSDLTTRSERSRPAASRAFLPARTTKVFETYWHFAAERQEVFFRRLRNDRSPLTSDPVIARHKFTNAYRASDRVSQFVIRNVIYSGDQSPTEVIFRTLLFKLFNKIDTWHLLERELGEIRYDTFVASRYEGVLSKAMRSGQRIYSAAYIMPAADRTQGRAKHSGHLELLSRMMRDDLPARLVEAPSLRDAFERLRAYPMMGDFLAYQYIIDLNYSSVMNFSEMEFIVPGPGARSGIRKCFSDTGGLSESDLIRLVTEQQVDAFAQRQIQFRNLWGRSLQLIDCQNLFCEVDKYARVAHPDVKVGSGRERIKQVYQRTPSPLEPWYPPKWGLNDRISVTMGAGHEHVPGPHR